MEQYTHVSSNSPGVQRDKPPEVKGGSSFYLEALVHPWRVFTSPSEVLAHPALSAQEKRAVLASWASDAYAVESAPALALAAGLRNSGSARRHHGSFASPRRGGTRAPCGEHESPPLARPMALYGLAQAGVQQFG